jgi:hypothetical protein
MAKLVDSGSSRFWAWHRVTYSAPIMAPWAILLVLLFMSVPPNKKMGALRPSNKK